MNRHRWIVAIVLLILLIIYLQGVMPGVGFIDSGELAAGCIHWGILHPTGYPMMTHLGFIAGNLPFLSNPILNLNIMCCFLCALALLFFADVLTRLSVNQVTDSKLPDLYFIVLGIIALGTSRFVLITAFELEVHALQFLLYAIIWALLTRFFSKSKEMSRKTLRLFLLLGFVFGLSLSNHGTSILILPAIFYLLYTQPGLRSFVIINRFLILLLLGFSSYIYLPIRSHSQPAMDWGDPETLSNFWSHITAWQYRVWMFQSWSIMIQNLSDFGHSLMKDFGILIAGFPFGIGVIWNIHRRFLILNAVIGLPGVLYIANYSIPDLYPYFIIIKLSVFLIAYIGIYSFTMKIMSKRVAIAVFTLIIGIQGVIAEQKTNRKGIHSTETYSRQVLSCLQPNALLMSGQWDVLISPLLYLQSVEAVRTDAIIIDRHLLKRSWYLTQIERMHSHVLIHCQNELADFRSQLVQFEAGKPYHPDLIQAAFEKLLTAIFMNYPGEKYITFEMMDLPAVFKDLALVPHGLVIAVDPSEKAGAPLEIEDYLPDVPERIRDERIPQTLLDFYYRKEMLMYGLYLDQIGFSEEAFEWSKAAESLKYTF